MIRIKVPATTTNLGPGFDCLGVALDVYNIIEVKEIDKGLEICVPEDQSKDIPLDSNNLVYIAMKKVFDKIGYSVKGLQINLNSNIPLTRGLGSSAACIVGGLTAANELAGRALNNDDIAQMAVEMDGHPDNVMPALEGGMVIACVKEGKVTHFRFNPPDNMKMALIIPDFYLPTVKARKSVPNSISVQDAVFNISRVALMTASLMTGKFDLLNVAVEDRIHQPYRKELIPHWDEIINNANALGAKGVFLSGAGPTMIAVLNENYQKFEQEMQQVMDQFNEEWIVKVVSLCTRGVQVL